MMNRQAISTQEHEPIAKGVLQFANRACDTYIMYNEQSHAMLSGMSWISGGIRVREWHSHHMGC